MTGERQLVVYSTAEEVADALAHRLLERLAEVQRSSRVAQLALTGGRIALQAYRRVAADAPGAAVDWTRVELWWGDERFVPEGDAERNAKQVLDVWRGVLSLDGQRIHVMPASDSGLALDEAAAAYDRELGDTTFDVCLLGMGPDGHVASIFPKHPSAVQKGRVIGVRNSPKPPPERISLTLEVINTSSEVWFCVTGEDKAEAANLALLGSGPVPVPAAGVAARQRTVWLLDEAAAAQLPPELRDLG